MNNTPLRIVQITDMHLFADTSKTLLGLNTEASFQSVLALVKQEEPKIDMILATGDITQQPEPVSYARFNTAMQQFKTPYYSMQGNHDHKAVFCNCQPNKSLCAGFCFVDIAPWAFILLDSSIEKSVAGGFTTEQLVKLDATLEKYKNRHILIAFHHPPISIGCAWLDKQQVKNASAFWDILSKHPNVKTIICGHVHQASETVHNQVVVYTTPSTCIQFKPNSADFALDDICAGYRWFNLHADGNIETGVSRIKKMPEGTQWIATGY